MGAASDYLHTSALTSGLLNYIVPAYEILGWFSKPSRPKYKPVYLLGGMPVRYMLLCISISLPAGFQFSMVPYANDSYADQGYHNTTTTDLLQEAYSSIKTGSYVTSLEEPLLSTYTLRRVYRLNTDTNPSFFRQYPINLHQSRLIYASEPFSSRPLYIQLYIL